MHEASTNPEPEEPSQPLWAQSETDTMKHTFEERSLGGVATCFFFFCIRGVGIVLVNETHSSLITSPFHHEIRTHRKDVMLSF